MRRQLAIIILASMLLMISKGLGAQQCTNRFTSVIHRGISFDTFTTAIYSSTKNIIAAGNISNDHGFAAKFSAAGSPLFSYQYNPIYQGDRSYFVKLKFTDIVETRDGSFLLAGSVVLDKFIGTTELINRIGVLLKLDKFGNVLWCKKFETANALTNSGFQLAVTNVIETSSGTIVVYLASDYGRNYPAFGRIVGLNADGSQKWNTLLATNNYDGGVKSLDTKRALMQARDGAVVLGDMIYKTDRSGITPTTVAAQLHFLWLDVTTGKMKWETNYQYPISGADFSCDLTSVSELANNSFVITSLAFTAAGGNKKGLRVATDGKGAIQSAVSYQSTLSSSTELIDVSTDKNAVDQWYLFKNNNDAVIANVNSTGAVVWQKGFSHSGGLFPVNCFTATDKGFAILMSNFKSRDKRLLLTDAAGVIDCANTTAQIVTQTVVLEKGDALITTPDIPDQNRFGTANFPIRADAYPFEKRIECEEQSSCCTDVIDSLNMPTINICEGSSYTLPDNSVVKTSGTYYSVYKTPGGCDSIKFYKLQVHKNPAALTLGDDVCLKEKDSAVLIATPGYTAYLWMNNVPTVDNEFKITVPGIYRVRVQNVCGSKTDSVSVFAACDFPIYLPNAFTPNGDGRNDVFGVPAQNKNKLIRLKIFNRWGQLIFSTENNAVGWDGKMNKQPQATGVYVYYIELRGLSGNVVTQNGTVLLVR
ncbi:MAG: gliding motility-associated C-terminal domain-containing protein [Bacteroidota bacterium]